VAINPIQFLVSPAASVSSGSRTVTLTGSVNASYVSSGTAVFIGSHPPVEAISGSGVNPATGTSTITLRQPWPHADVVDARTTTFNTIEGLSEAIRRNREIIAGAETAADDYIAASDAVQALITHLQTTQAEMQTATDDVEARLDATEQALDSIDATLQDYVSAAQTSAQQAADRAADISADVAKAKAWADGAEDAEVEPGRYSSKHHAAKSAASASAAETHASDAGQSASTAGEHASTAEEQKTAARNWAQAAVDVELAPGRYSAYHWATTAAGVYDATVTIRNQTQTLHDQTAALRNESQRLRDEQQQIAGGDAGNALALGGETAEEWQGKLDKAASDEFLRNLLARKGIAAAAYL